MTLEGRGDRRQNMSEKEGNLCSNGMKYTFLRGVLAPSEGTDIVYAES
jgi:hypothetical protein